VGTKRKLEKSFSQKESQVIVHRTSGRLTGSGTQNQAGPQGKGGTAQRKKNLSEKLLPKASSKKGGTKKAFNALTLMIGITLASVQKKEKEFHHRHSN